MTLTNLIDLIAEVAAKRATREGGTKEETPNAVVTIIPRILAELGQASPYFVQVGFVFLTKMPQPRGPKEILND